MVIDTKQPEVCIKSAAFRDFIRKRLFPIAKYDLLLNNESDKTNMPCFKFKSRNGGREFYVDARYLAGDANVPVEWCQPFELEKFQEINSATPVYILIGAGPSAAAPRQVFLFPIKSIRFNRLLYSYIEKYKISVTRTLEEKDLL
jgi:hypothetical protein